MPTASSSADSGLMPISTLFDETTAAKADAPKSGGDLRPLSELFSKADSSKQKDIVPLNLPKLPEGTTIDFPALRPKAPEHLPLMDSPFMREVGEFFQAAKTPQEAVLQDSLPANLYKAYKQGVFNKPLSEIIRDHADDLKNAVDMQKLGQMLKDHPGLTTATLWNTIIADPELLLIPGGLGGKVAKAMGEIGELAGKSTAMLGRVTGRAAEGAIVGGSIGAATSAAGQLAERGYITPQKTGKDAELMTELGAFAGMFGKAGKSPKDIKEILEPKQIYTDTFPAAEVTPVEPVRPPVRAALLDNSKFASVVAQAHTPPPVIPPKTPQTAALLRNRQAGYITPEEAGYTLATAGLGYEAYRLFTDEDHRQEIRGAAKDYWNTLRQMWEPRYTPPKRDDTGKRMLADGDTPWWLLGGAALAIKGKGGMWHPEAIDRLRAPIFDALIRGSPKNITQAQEWSTKAVLGWLNKHAGTATDPLRDVKIPMLGEDMRWEDVTNKAFLGTKVKPHTPNAPVGELQVGDIPGAKEGETVWDVYRSRTEARGLAAGALSSYLAHVGDYLREHVPAEKLQQYDLVRAVRETAAQDEKQARAMAKARANQVGTALYKEYPDGMRWVEVGAGDASKEAKDAALKNEGDVMGHCVGDYCELVHSGQSKIYSLRDRQGMSHVTVEVRPERMPGRGLEPGKIVEDGESIIQIKGKQKRAPIDKYLPYVQDFVKSGNWRYVGDLRNTGLHRLSSNYGIDYPAKWYNSPQEPLLSVNPKDLGLSPGYYTEPELRAAAEAYQARTGDVGFGPKEKGQIDPKLLRSMGLLLGGGALGAAIDPDHPIVGAVLGALGASAGIPVAAGIAKSGWELTRALANGNTAKMKPGTILGSIKAGVGPDQRIRITSEMNDAEVFVQRENLARSRLVRSLAEDVPDKERRGAISHWLEGDTSIPLTEKEHKAALRVKDFYARMGQAAVDRGVLEDLIDQYVTHLYGREAKPVLDEILKERQQGGTTTPFAKRRVGPPTIREVNNLLQARGLKPITDDIAVITEAYGRSLTNAMANKQVIDVLKARRVGADKTPLIMSAGKAPPFYIPFGRAYLVAHPDIVPALRFQFGNTNSGNAFVRGIEAVNTVAKRVGVSFSAFHTTALVVAHVGAASLRKGEILGGAALGGLYGATQGDPITYALIGAGMGMMWRPGKIVAQAALPSVFKNNKYIEALRHDNPQMAAIIDLGFQGGLKYTFEKGDLAVEDVGQSFYGGMHSLQQLADQHAPAVGVGLKGLEELNHKFDGFLWERLHPSFKLELFAEKYGQLLKNNPGMATEEVAKIAASYTNDMFGGLNWRRVAEEAKSKWGRDLAMGALSPVGRRGLQLLMYAPDWTISTFRAAAKSLGSGDIIKGLANPKTAGDLHRQYLLRAALFYATLGDGVNYALSGHHLWQNKDPFTIDMGDGRHMQLMKHATEFPHWFTNFWGQAVGKQSWVLKEAKSQALGIEYPTSTGRAPPMKGSRLGHLARSFTPIFAQNPEPAGIASSILGVPIYGKTSEDVESARRNRRRAIRIPKALRSDE